MQYTFFYYPITCATAAHIILIESGLDFDTKLVDIREGEHHNEWFMSQNPKAYIPALMTPNGLLTENQAILSYVADLVPNKKLIPKNQTFARATAHEWMNFCAASIHPAVRSVFRPSAYAGDCEITQRGVRSHGLSLIKKYGDIVEQKLKAGEWSVENEFSVADAYLYLMYLWSQDKRMEPIQDFPNWRSLALRVHERESTTKVLSIELSNRIDYTLPPGFANP